MNQIKALLLIGKLCDTVADCRPINDETEVVFDNGGIQ